MKYRQLFVPILLLVTAVGYFMRSSAEIRSVDFVIVFAIGFLSGILFIQLARKINAR